MTELHPRSRYPLMNEDDRIVATLAGEISAVVPDHGAGGRELGCPHDAMPQEPPP